MNLKKISMLVIPMFIFSLSVLPAFASSNDTVRNTNDATVRNEVMIGANTGGNLADGSWGGNGGRGGNIANTNGEEEGDVRDSMTGRGGNGGNAGVGGTVVTGNSTAVSMIANDVNHNRTHIDRCGCEGEEAQVCDCDEREEGECCEKNVRVSNDNTARVGNRVMMRANTGDNSALGSYGGEAGNGGNIANDGDGDVDTSTTGIGGNGGAGSAGGAVQTGLSNARSEIMSVVNTNITRIRR